MTTWDIQESRDHIVRLFGREQLERARPSLSSVVDRQRHARYHYHEAINLLKQHIGAYPADTSPLYILLGGDDEQQNELDLCLTKVGANVIACVQSIHAVADILAHATYFSLGLNLLTPPLSEVSISLATVSAQAKLHSEYKPVADMLESLGSGGEFAHIAALANHAKHRSIIRPSVRHSRQI